MQGYDVFDVLTNYWRVQLADPEGLADQIVKLGPPTPAVYGRVKDRLTEHWSGEKPIAYRRRLAAHDWFNHNLSYGPGFLGWMSRIYQDPRRFARLVEKVRSFRAPGVRVGLGSFEETMPGRRKDFLYCDPPYFLDGDSRMFRGIYPSRNLPLHHRTFDHRTLRDILHAHEGGFLLSYNDCSAVREWYADYEIHELEWQYTLGQGETRIGRNRARAGVRRHVKPSHELLIVGRKRG